MFDTLKPQTPDKIIQLIQQVKDDPRKNKIDLGVGVYRNSEGITPVMKAVKAAERELWLKEDTKTYTALAGDPAYHDAMIELVLSNVVDRGRIAAVHTPGGTGAVRLSFELVRLTSPEAEVWIPSPSWPNHRSMLNFLSVPMREYRYFDQVERSVDFDGMMEDLSCAKQGDSIVLHGCCHNPTGSDLNSRQWKSVADLVEEKGIVPIVDFAYQGFGDGLQEDASGARLMAARFPEMMIAASCSKNFGIYRERTGILLSIAPDERTRNILQGMLAHLNRQSISFPPDHGARLVTMILSEPELRKMWQTELDEIRNGLLSIRSQLAGELQRLSNSERFAFLTAHKGMFSLLGATPEQVQLMRERHGVYLVGDSRINVAGLSEDSVPRMAKAMLDVGM